MAFIRIFNDGDLKLAGQADHGGCGQERQTDPARTENILSVQKVRWGPGEDFPRSICQGEYDKQPDSKQGKQFDQGFQCDGGDHPMVAFIRINIAGCQRQS